MLPAVLEQEVAVGSAAGIGQRAIEIMRATSQEGWKFMAIGTYAKFPLGDKSDDFRWYVGSRLALARNWAVRLEYNHRDHDNDVLFSVQAFF